MSTSNALNAIFKGYAFSQDLLVDADDFPEGVILWFDLRSATAPKTVRVDATELDRIDPTTFRLELSAEQTADLPLGLLEGDLIVRGDDGDVHLGIRIEIPVLEPASEPRP